MRSPLEAIIYQARADALAACFSLIDAAQAKAKAKLTHHPQCNCDWCRKGWSKPMIQNGGGQ